jgi:aspartyl/asparaginyl-tRNA synthetase
MEYMPQDKTIGSLTDDELYEIALDPETLKTIEAVIKENQQFKDMTFIQLNDSKEFQQALKEYRLKNLPQKRNEVLELELETLRSISPKNHVKPNNKLAKKITKNIISEGEVGLVINNKKSKKDVITMTLASF